MTPSVSLIGIVNLQVLVSTKCYPKLPVWWATYVRKTVNASSIAGYEDQNSLMIVENSSGYAVVLQTELVATLVRITLH